MKRVLFIGLSLLFCIVLSLSAFAIDSSYTQLDFIPVDEVRVYSNWDSPVVMPGSSLSTAADGYSCTVSSPNAFLPGGRYGVKVWGEGDYIFRAQGMSLYVLCLDMRLAFVDFNTVAGVPLDGNVKIRFLDVNGDAASNFIYNSGESSDHFVKYFTFVLRETSNLDIYGLEAQFVFSNSSQPDSGLANPNHFVFSNFGWKYSTGTEEVQIAIMNGVDVLVYGNETLQKLQAAGYETFDEFVSYEDIFMDYATSNFDENYFANLPAIGYSNGFLFWRILSSRIPIEFPMLNGLIVFAIAVGVAGALFGLIGKAVSVKEQNTSDESVIHLHYHDHRGGKN